MDAIEVRIISISSQFRSVESKIGSIDCGLCNTLTCAIAGATDRCSIECKSKQVSDTYHRSDKRSFESNRREF